MGKGTERMPFVAESYEIVVVGAGHAGCEAALACARMGCETLLMTLNMDGVALMPCNPSIGGTAKGHLVREVDALGGEMGRAIDDTFIQSRMLNTGKGPAVHSLRAQADKRQYQRRMLRALQTQERLTLKQGEAADFLAEGGRVTGVATTTGAVYPCKAVIVATGGLGREIVPHCRRKITYVDDLLLEGLRMIYEKNKGKV